MRSSCSLALVLAVGLGTAFAAGPSPEPRAHAFHYGWYATAAAGLEVAFHLEPFPGRDADTGRKALTYLFGKDGDHPACHRPAAWGGRPVVDVDDSYLTPARDWARLRQPDGEISIRGTRLDRVMIGLWVHADPGTRRPPATARPARTTTASSPPRWHAIRPSSPSPPTTSGTREPRSSRPCRSRSTASPTATTFLAARPATSTGPGPGSRAGVTQVTDREVSPA